MQETGVLNSHLGEEGDVSSLSVAGERRAQQFDGIKLPIKQIEL